MPIRISITLDPKAREKIKRLTKAKVDAAINRGLGDFALKMKRHLAEASYRLTRSPTGTYARSWGFRLGEGTLTFSNDARAAGSKAYAIFLEFGTGIYGPKHRPIVPTHAKALRFNPSGRAPSAFKVGSGRLEAYNGGFIMRRSVAGIQPRFTFRRTWEENAGDLLKSVGDELRVL